MTVKEESRLRVFCLDITGRKQYKDEEKYIMCSFTTGSSAKYLRVMKRDGRDGMSNTGETSSKKQNFSRIKTMRIYV